MPSIKQASKDYESSKTHNICELNEISVDENIEVEVRTDKDGKEYKIQVLKRGKEEYRVPFTINAQLKNILDKKPDMKKFAVAKTGDGIATQYTVIPL